MEIIDVVGLKGWDRYKPNQPSGGMQQRVGLARALAVNPELMLFDEPFSALDPLIRAELQDELLRLQATLKKTSVFITHDFSEALRIGDRVAIMKDGRFVQIGTPEQLLLYPESSYVRAFVKDAPRIRVLTAGSIMTAVRHRDTESCTPRVDSTASLESIVPQISTCDRAVQVTNSVGAVVGEIDRATFISALVRS